MWNWKSNYVALEINILQLLVYVLKTQNIKLVQHIISKLRQIVRLTPIIALELLRKVNDRNASSQTGNKTKVHAGCKRNGECLEWLQELPVHFDARQQSSSSLKSNGLAAQLEPNN